MHKLMPRFFMLPAGALAVIAALAQAHGDQKPANATVPSIQRAADCVTTAAPSACVVITDSRGTPTR
jgi:hypothetical protein